MSNAALAQPLRRPLVGSPREEPQRHLEIAPSRAQRRARPRPIHAVIVIAGIGAILLAQLLLSIALAGGAYDIAHLQGAQRDLQRQENALGEQLDTLSSPQHLAASAERLGMVASGSLPYIDLASGTVSGKAGVTGGSILGANGGYVGNTLLSGVPVIDPAAIAAAQAADAQAAGTATDGGAVGTTSGAPAASNTISSTSNSTDPSTPGASGAGTPAGPGTLASPDTH